ncbi:MAG TPA: peptidase M6 [Actinomycetota bacterium]|nr:peptidase M6 [Actinomycetota bacterium]
MRKVALALAAVVAIALVPMVTSAAPRSGGGALGPDIREVHPKDRPLEVPQYVKRQLRAAARADTKAPPVVGEERFWLGYDDLQGYYVKAYTLRGIGNNIEVWVASDEDEISTGTDFPADDCRNDGERNVITDTQVDHLIDEFDNNMYPIESNAFSVAPPRDGSAAPLAELLGLPKGYYKGPGDRIVTLIDNVRDANFYDTDNQSGFTYIAGFYSSLYDFYFNRLAMTIDAFDWLHRTGPNPPNEPSSDLCLNANARPFLYEGVFAHEYQHLLENYADFDETSWVNEGVSDYAQTITGYVDPSIPVTQIGQDSHIQCFLGFLDEVTPANPIPRSGGPENSLTLWGDQTDYESEILCDYGAAYSFMEYLAGRFGHPFLTGLHLGAENGLDSLAALLTQAGSTAKPLDVIGSWATMVAVDKSLDAGFSLVGGTPAEFRTPTLNAEVDWEDPEAFAGPGAPPNGSDYVRLRDATDAFVDVGDVDSIGFNGASKLAKLPVEWKVVKKAGRKVLYSGRGDNLDRAIAQKVKVEDGDLVVDMAWDTEAGYDYAYVQVSTDGGKKYKSVRCEDSIDAPLGPGFDASSDGFVHEECNLSRYAGKTVVLAFRYVTDGGVIEPGFWVDDVILDGRLISNGTTLQGWKSPTQIHPVEVKAWVVRLVAIDATAQQVRIGTIPLDASFDGSLSGADLDAIIGTTGSTVAAIVTFLDRSETIIQTAPYSLTVNGVLQPGG